MKAPCAPFWALNTPCFRGGMAWVADASLVAAGQRSGRSGPDRRDEHVLEILREEIRKAKTLTDKPFGVNIMLMSPYADAVGAGGH